MQTSRRMKRLEAQRQIISHFEEKIPYFTDVFDEKTFYISFGCLVGVCILLAILLSVCCRVTITDADELARQREERKRLKQQKLAEKLLRKKMAKAGLNPNADISNMAEFENIIKKLKECEKKKNESELELDENKND